MPNPI
jgi:hypothetical protein